MHRKKKTMFCFGGWWLEHVLLMFKLAPVNFIESKWYAGTELQKTRGGFTKSGRFNQWESGLRKLRAILFVCAFQWKLFLSLSYKAYTNKTHDLDSLYSIDYYLMEMIKEKNPVVSYRSRFAHISMQNRVANIFEFHTNSLPTRSRGINLSSAPCFRKTLPADCCGRIPIPSSLIIAVVAGSTPNSSAANFSTAVKGVLSGTLKLFEKGE